MLFLRIQQTLGKYILYNFEILTHGLLKYTIMSLIMGESVSIERSNYSYMSP